MLHEDLAARQHESLTPAIAAFADEADRTGGFPEAAFDLLRKCGVVASPPLAAGSIGALLRLLADVGRGDLNVGRIFEGHVNAMLLIETYGDALQKRRFGTVTREGGLLGVWNTDLPGDPLRLEGDRLVGRKNFSSGVDGLSHAIVTVPGDAGRRMIVVPLAGLPVDRSWWKPMGMRASGSHIVDFGGLTVAPGWMLGGPDVYIRQPLFSAGAIRFAAVQVGGMHAVFDVALSHLRRIKREGDPYQAHRIARMGMAVETSYAWLDRAAAAWMDAASHPGAGKKADRLVATVNAARSVVETSALAVLEDAERSVGAGGFIAPHPLERLIRDLRTYLRQPNPDGALAAVGAAIGDDAWAPGHIHEA